MKNEPTATRNMIDLRLNVKVDSVKHHLDKMKKLGIIEHVGSTKSGYWEMKE